MWCGCATVEGRGSNVQKMKLQEVGTRRQEGGEGGRGAAGPAGAFSRSIFLRWSPHPLPPPPPSSLPPPCLNQLRSSPTTPSILQNEKTGMGSAAKDKLVLGEKAGWDKNGRLSGTRWKFQVGTAGLLFCRVSVKCRGSLLPPHSFRLMQRLRNVALI